MFALRVPALKAHRIAHAGDRQWLTSRNLPASLRTHLGPALIYAMHTKPIRGEVLSKGIDPKAVRCGALVALVDIAGCAEPVSGLWDLRFANVRAIEPIGYASRKMWGFVPEEFMGKVKEKPKEIPAEERAERTVSFWGNDYQVTPAVVEQYHGDGKALLIFQPLNTRPDYYLIRVDSACVDRDVLVDAFETQGGIIDLIIDEYSEIERERENLEWDLREQGIEPDGYNTDLDGNEDRLGWPVVSLDCGYGWHVYAPGEW